MNIIVYTAVIGPDVDRLKPVVVSRPNVQFLCFTDQPGFTVDGWTMMGVVPENVRLHGPIHCARACKIAMPLFGADVMIWHDSAYQLSVDPNCLAKQAETVHALRHPWRSSPRDEGREIVRLKLAPADKVEAQVASWGEWEPGTLTSTGLLVRKNTEAVRRFNETWWELFQAGGHTRDQMSVDRASYVSGVPIQYLDGHYRDNPYAIWEGHRR